MAQQKVLFVALNRPAKTELLPAVELVDAVTNTCSQICVHLSENLYDMVLHMVFDYASTNVRSNAVRAIHQLVECVANANPEKTLAKFFYLCDMNIRTELENGASSLRTTAVSAPAPSDATLHWSKSPTGRCRMRLMLLFRSGYSERRCVQVSDLMMSITFANRSLSQRRKSCKFTRYSFFSMD
jgi:hypothetical protein